MEEKAEKQAESSGAMGEPKQVDPTQEMQLQQQQLKLDALPDNIPVFVGEWDIEGVYLYQAFCNDIADWAIANQRLGGPKFNTTRMTWIKPSLAWMLYRSGYGKKPGQNRVLKIKLSHCAIADVLRQCKCVNTNKETRSKSSADDGVSNGIVQWDPERDIMSADGKEPRMMLRRRAIQIGLKGRLSEQYVNSILSIQDVTELCHRICEAHRSKKRDAMAELEQELPQARSYLPLCSDHCLVQLGMLPGETASAMAQIGRGKALQGLK